MAMPMRLPLLLAVVCSACRPAPPDTGPAPKKEDPVLVRGVGVTVTVGTVQDRLTLEPMVVRSGLQDPQRKQAYLDMVVDEELQLAEARRLALDQVPEYKAAVRSLLLQQLWHARARERNARGPVDGAAQYEVERKAWVEELRARAKLEPQQAAIDAFAP